MAQQMNYLMYGAVMVIGWVSQGGLALYYLRRKPLVDQLNSTPEWERQLITKVA